MGAMVLVVDDDPELRGAVGFVLGGRFDVRQAACGREALEAVALRRPDLVLLDMSMPEMSGLEVLAALRRAAPSLPVVILTGDSDIADAAKALDLGARTFITKPFEPGVLLEEVSLALAVVPDADEDDVRPWRVVP